jgi:hypothetical protein
MGVAMDWPTDPSNIAHFWGVTEKFPYIIQYKKCQNSKNIS